MNLLKERLQNYQYALDQVGQFLDQIKSSPLRDNTVIAITADNNTIEGNMIYDDFINDSKKIPFYLYIPLKLKRKIVDFKKDLPCSHKDIFPTLYHLTLSDAIYYSVGDNLLKPNPQKAYCGFNAAGIINTEEGAFQFQQPKTEKQRKCEIQYQSSMRIIGYIINSYR
jgi:phosphoglycerol transferase MdoB-like AlkP superfamily enzyme